MYIIIVKNRFAIHFVYEDELLGNEREYARKFKTEEKAKDYCIEHDYYDYIIEPF